ncbi:sensor domain-containing phosphodiesterase [Robbsia sp. KACC 23696]|uniref:sensor domain-containing diguanylate cyclase n=1 Tax=Robbsia sp. KACC 23696 TaxID=3149231 RepID=UPI00325C33D6
MSAKPEDQHSRVDALRSTRRLRYASEPFYDEITALTAKLFQTPHADILLINAGKHWGKSRHGFACHRPFHEIPFCRHTIDTSGITVVADASLHPHFQDDPLVDADPGVRFYVGAPLYGDNDTVIGLLCAFGPTPCHTVGEIESEQLLHLAAAVSEHLKGVRAVVYQDPATALPSLPSLIEDMQHFIHDLQGRPQTEAYAVMIDVYSLADINHLVIAMGILAVSQVAITAATRLRAVLPDGVVLYRVGYARYVFFQATEYHVIADLTQRCAAAFDRPMTVGESVPIDVNPHIGVVGLHPTTDAFALASELLAISEEARRLRVPMLLGNASFSTKTRRAFEIINSVKRALQSDPPQFRLVFQPVVDLPQQAVSKFEALIRWAHPSLGELMPGEFLPLIEATALMPRLTTWVLNAAAKQLAEWGADAAHIKLAVNIGASDLMREDLGQDIVDALAPYGVATSRLECEVTETALISSFEQGIKNIAALKRLGVAVSIDDFGAGYSNLAYLQRFAVDALKIDQSLVRSISENARDAAIVRAAISLAHELGYTVTIEGVETSGILSLVDGWGAECAQGYAISRPMEAADVSAWIPPPPLGTTGEPVPRPLSDHLDIIDSIL